VALVINTGPKNLAVRHTHTHANRIAIFVLIQQSTAPIDGGSPTKLRATVNFISWLDTRRALAVNGRVQQNVQRLTFVYVYGVVCVDVQV